MGRGHWAGPGDQRGPAVDELSDFEQVTMLQDPQMSHLEIEYVTVDVCCRQSRQRP